MKNEITPYLEIRDKITTFTIINCEHNNWFWSRIGHTAVVYKCRDTGQLMVLESNRFTGVRLMPFGKWLSEYDGEVFIRIPEFVNDTHDTIDFANYERCYQAHLFIKEHLGSSYPNLKSRSGRFKLYFAALDLKIFGKDIFTYKGDDKGIFCTMLVVMFLQYCGLLLKEIKLQSTVKRIAPEPNEYEPDNMRGDHGMFGIFLNNVKFGKEIQIK